MSRVQINTRLDDELKREFEFQNFEKIDQNIIREFKSKFSIKSRIQNQLNKFLKKYKIQ